MNRIIILTAFIIVSWASSVFAQGSVAVQYSINFPTGNTVDYISSTSFMGTTFDYNYRINPNLSVGFSAGWYTFYENEDYGTYTTEGEVLAISGKLYKYVNSSPLLFTVDYHLASSGPVSPFIGLGIGTTYNRHETQIGIFDLENDSWQFTLAPEVGVEIPFSDTVGGYVSLRYNNCFEAADLDTQSYLTLNLGLLLGGIEY